MELENRSPCHQDILYHMFIHETIYALSALKRPVKKTVPARKMKHGQVLFSLPFFNNPEGIRVDQSDTGMPPRSIQYASKASHSGLTQESALSR